MKNYYVSRIQLFNILSSFPDALVCLQAGQTFAQASIKDEDATAILAKYPNSIQLI